jgi:hypothetical protein
MRNESNNNNIMKAKFMLVAVIAMVASVAFATEPNAKVAVVGQKQSGTYKVIYNGEGKVKLNIRNTAGETIFAETINTTKGFIRPVNFAGLEFGEYTIEIANAAGKQIQKIQYQAETVAKNIHVAKISEEGKYLLAVAGKDAEQINVKIFDGANNLVHDKNITVNGNLGLVYNLKQVSGTPTFEVTDNAGVVKTIKY